ncbi:DUF3987 domain-containing protein [Bacteroides caecigallinarum]|nr:DUF3987 domain-containing protein [Bacteroides caecigallinarum]
MKITIFSSLMTKEAESVIDAAEWIRYIRDGKFKPTVDQVRSYIKLGDKDRARDWKMKLPAAVWAGECRKGRFFKHTTTRTGYAIFDFDDLREDQLLAARQLLEVFPWVVAIHVTASGRGLRVVANIGIVHIDVYRQAYEQVAERLHEITGLEPDMACKDFARASLASYDPDAYYNPQATVFPYGEEHNPLNYVPATGPDTSEDFRYLSNPVTQALDQGYRSEDAPDVDAVINRFFYTHPYVKGSRTRTMLSLGQYLRWRGVQSWQLDNAIHTACARGVEPGITQKEIERAIRWGYEHGEEGGKSPTNYGHYGHYGHMNPNFDEKTGQTLYNQGDTETEADEDEKIDTYCGAIPDEVFDNLPSDIKELLKIAKDNKERDTLFLSILAISSGLFPALRTMYGNQIYTPHLYVCEVAQAGSGKGLAMNALTLAKSIQDALDRQYKEEKRDYDKRLLSWELELKRAAKENREPDINLRPEEPKRKVLILQANTSKSQMLLHMSVTEFGNILATTEIDSFAEALRTDYGKHAAEIRMFFHHERVGQSYKTDKDPVVIDFPKLALMLSGTPEQLVNFIRTLEDGMYSRFMFYTMSPTYKWKNQSPLEGNGNINARELFASVGEKMKANFFKTKDKEIMINFTREQWDRHTEIFQRELGYVAAEENPNVMAIVFRSGLITMRVAMVLCGYRIMEAGWDVNEYTCSDEDFDNAIKIVLTCMAHSINLSTIISNTVKRQKLTNYYKLLPVLKTMKKEFRYIDFVKECKKRGFEETAAKRALTKYLKSGLISRTSDGYKKNRK